MVTSKGCEENVSEYFDGRVIEVIATTFEDLINSINMLAEYGSKMKVRESIEYISGLKDECIEKTFAITVKVAPQTEMASRIVKSFSLGFHRTA